MDSKKRYYLDTEFIDDGKTIDLISIGIVGDDDKKMMYAVNKECDFSKASDWVLKNVLKPMGLDTETTSENIHLKYLGHTADCMSRSSILHNVKHFLGSDKFELWASYASYDWVAFCQLFGKMVDLPENYPMFIHDTEQLRKILGIKVEDFPLKNGSHNALEDAIYVREVVRALAINFDITINSESH